MPSIQDCSTFFIQGIEWGVTFGLIAWFTGYGLSHLVGMFKGL